MLTIALGILAMTLGFALHSFFPDDNDPKTPDWALPTLRLLVWGGCIMLSTGILIELIF